MSGLRAFAAHARDLARLLAGIPPYAAYLEHMRAHHPGIPPMTEAAFCRDRQAARFDAGKGPGGCC